MDTNPSAGNERTRTAPYVVAVVVLGVVAVALAVAALYWTRTVRQSAQESREQLGQVTAEWRAFREQQKKRDAALGAGDKRALSAEEQVAQEATWETQKMDLADKLADRVNPILAKLGEGQALTSEQIEAARTQIVREIQSVVKEEQRRNAELQKMMAGEQKRGQDLEGMIAAEQKKGKQLQGMLEAEQGVNAELQAKGMSTYQVAADAFRLANELRVLYLQERKRDSSVLANALETVTLPIKVVGNTLNRNILNSDEQKRREQELKKAFNDLALRMEQYAPKSSLLLPPVPAPAPGAEAKTEK